MLLGYVLELVNPFSLKNKKRKLILKELEMIYTLNISKINNSKMLYM